MKNATLILAFAHFARKEPRLVQTRRGFRLVTGDVARKPHTQMWPIRRNDFCCRFRTAHFVRLRSRNDKRIQADFDSQVLVQLRNCRMRATQSTD